MHRSIHKVGRVPTVGGASGFAIVELLVVISIIGVLAAIAFPVMSTAKEHARRAVCMNNLRQIGIAILMYAADNGGRTPPQPEGLGRGHHSDEGPCFLDSTQLARDRFGIDYCVADLLMPYAPDRGVFVCPSEARQSFDRPYDNCINWTYAYCAPDVDVTRGPLRAVDYGDPSRIWLACDIQGPGWGSNHTRRAYVALSYINVLYLDGHVRGMLKQLAGTPGFSYDDTPPTDNLPHLHGDGHRR